MNAHTNERQKFNSAEILTIILVVVLLVTASFLAYKNYHDTKSKINSNSSAKSKTISTKNWKSFTLLSDNLSFKYPQTWTVAENQNINGTDFVEFKGSDNFVFTIANEQNITTARKNSINPTILGTEKITFVKHTAYLMFFGNGEYVTSAIIATSPVNPSSAPKDENAGGGSNKYVLVSMYYPDKPISLQSAVSGTEYQNSVKLIESMRF